MHILPIFPLPTVLFPGSEMGVYAFERRYIQLVRRCHHNHSNFAIALIRKGLESGGPLPEPYLTVTEGRIIKYDQRPSGEIDLHLRGEQRVRIRKFLPGEPYLVAEVEPLALDWPPGFDPAQVARLVPWMRAYFTQLTRLPYADALKLGQLDLPDDPEKLLYRAASLLVVKTSEWQRWLEIESAPELMADLLHVLRIEVVVQAVSAQFPLGEKSEKLAKNC